eukprot:GEMP01022310.1.p1 GENE.GEMP01022310.1~~GEMP01022310.1.p1  ORF type:complete len:667 (+),score=153.92 GEMP01022310.1:12-2012(+)
MDKKVTWDENKCSIHMEIDTSKDPSENARDESAGPLGDDDTCPATPTGPWSPASLDRTGSPTVPWRPTMTAKPSVTSPGLASRRGSEGGFTTNYSNDGTPKTKKTISKKQPTGSPSARTVAIKRYQGMITNFTKKREQAAIRKKSIIEDMVKAHPDNDSDEGKNEELFTKWADIFQTFDAEGEDKLSAAEIGVICRSQGGNLEICLQQTIIEKGRNILNAQAPEAKMGLVLSGGSASLLDSDKKDTWDMNLRQFLQLAWALHTSDQMGRRRTFEKRFNMAVSSNTPKKPHDHIREAVMQLYDESFFPPDEFFRRVNSGSKKEQPKEKEFNEKAAQMSLALQNRLHHVQTQTKIYQKDLQSYVQIATSLTTARHAQMDELLSQKIVLRTETEVMQKRVQEEEQRLQQMERKHQANLVEWQERSEKLWAQKEELLLQQRRLEIQLRSDRQGAAEFMARTLQKEHQLQELKEILPKCQKLSAELDRLTEENSVIIKLLTDCLKFLEESLPEENRVAEKCRQTGMDLEMSLRALLNKYHTICIDAGTRVEDVLPYSKVARRPGGYQGANCGRIPGEVRQVIRPVNILQQAAKKVVATHALQHVLRSVASSFTMPMPRESSSANEILNATTEKTQQLVPGAATCPKTPASPASASPRTAATPPAIGQNGTS